MRTQRRMLERVLSLGEGSSFAIDYEISSSTSYEEFARKVPIFDYDSFKPYIERMLSGERGVATRGVVRKFAKSSGTTADRSKFIPVTNISLRRNHMRGMRDVCALYIAQFPDTNVLSGKILSLGGSCKKEGSVKVGDLSGLLMDWFKVGSGWLRAPKLSTALIEDFDEKAQRIIDECRDENITAFLGVPSWNMALLSRLVEQSEGRSLKQIWPNLELFAHGGIELSPYRSSLEHLYGGEGLRYMESYNASEGFFAIADDISRGDMLLMLDYDTFYEFHEGDRVVPLWGVELGHTYALIISASNGLWRYEIGDRVRFTSIKPYRIKFAGRTRQFINAFGEEVIVDNTDEALRLTCYQMQALTFDYSVAPRFMSLTRGGCHEWLVEFVRPPKDLELFAARLDENLRNINSDYDAKRSSTMSPLELTSLRRGTLLRWMQRYGKSKIPRLSGERWIYEQIKLLNEQSDVYSNSRKYR